MIQIYLLIFIVIDIITIEEEDFIKLASKTIERLHGDVAKEKSKWIAQDEAMNILHIISKSTLQKHRNDVSLTYAATDNSWSFIDKKFTLPGAIINDSSSGLWSKTYKKDKLT